MVIFATFLNPELDADILCKWIRHYARYDFDRYHAILHVALPGEASAKQCEIYKTAHVLLHHNNFTVEEISGEYNNAELMQTAMAAFKTGLKKSDTLVQADSDEFHVMPIDYKAMAERFDYITGNLVDRWDPDLKAANDSSPLAEQYPLSGNIYDYLIKKYSLTDPQWVWGRQLTKVLCHKVRYLTDLSGNHFIVDPQQSENVLTEREVRHYTWRRGIINRIMDRTYNPEWWTRVFLHYWNIGPGHPDYARFMETHRRRQAERGLNCVYA